MIALAIIFVFLAHYEITAVDIAPSVHAFFYLWYGIPEFDGTYMHWDHKVLPHWESDVNERHPSIGRGHNPPANIHSPFYPLQNPYSTKDPKNLARQFADMNTAKISVAVVSWWGQPDNKYATDSQGVTSDLVMHDIFRAADLDGHIKIAFHLEPYRDRCIDSIRGDIDYIIRTYGNYTSIYRPVDRRPMFYIYDSYHIDIAQWHRMLSPQGDLTVRNSHLDAHFIGLLLNSHDGHALKNGGFDGVYTYFASDGFSYGSTTSNWEDIADFSRENDLICILSVGPGYEDISIRPWNSHNSRARSAGEYYDRMWQSAIAANPSIVSITSYNEWGEGTQIEPAKEVIGMKYTGKDYLHYGEGGPYMYLNLTTVYAKEFLEGTTHAWEEL